MEGVFLKRKDYNKKKQQIIEAANALFINKGYESTTVDEILASINISKGTFYHYFNSKDELLQAIVNNFTNSFLQDLAEIVNNVEMSALQKLNAYFELNQSMKISNQSLITMVIAVWFKEENLIYKQRLNKSLIKSLSPHLEKILIQGVHEGTFDIIEPGEIAVLIINLGFCLRDRLIEELMKESPDINKLVTIAKTYQRSKENILNLPADSLIIFAPNAFSEVIDR